MVPVGEYSGYLPGTLLQWFRRPKREKVGLCAASRAQGLGIAAVMVGDVDQASESGPVSDDIRGYTEREREREASRENAVIPVVWRTLLSCNQLRYLSASHAAFLNSQSSNEVLRTKYRSRNPPNPRCKIMESRHAETLSLPSTGRHRQVPTAQAQSGFRKPKFSAGRSPLTRRLTGPSGGGGSGLATAPAPPWRWCWCSP